MPHDLHASPRGSRLTSRRGSWTTLLLGLLLAIALVGGLRGVDPPGHADGPPPTSESARAAAALAALPQTSPSTVLLVASRQDGARLADADVDALTALARSVAPGPARVDPVRSGDGRAAVVAVPLPRGDDASLVEGVRSEVHAASPTGLDVLVTGGPAFGVDIAAAFDGADVRLLLASLGIVALLLIVTYRSPVLWLIPLTVVALADQVAAAVTASIGATFDLHFDAGIVSVLVFGAGTNYALLLVSRYREELSRTPSHRTALADAWRQTVPAIVASNLTVVLALTTLVLAVLPGTGGLGVAAAVGLLVTVVLVLTLLPAALAVTGRRVFWPRLPRPGAPSAPERSLFGRTAERVTRRPLVVALACVLGLGVLTAGLAGTRLGLEQVDRFRTPSESADGLRVVQAHFPAGAAQPLSVVTRAGSAGAVTDAVSRLDGVVSAHPAGGGGAGRGSGTTPDGIRVVTIVTDAAPGTERARDQVARVREAAQEADPAALVGGAAAAELDTRTASERDLLLIVPFVLLASALVLGLLLRSAVAAAVLVPVNVLSALATIGAGSWLGRHLLGWPALDGQVPLLAFLFLVALGIDYTIFLTHRARSEASAHGTRAGMVRAVSATGAVITSAGLVLAAVFAALGVLPLVTLGQLGLIVGLGVLLDTFVVRTLLVPALFALIGDRVWWPSRPGVDLQ